MRSRGFAAQKLLRTVSVTALVLGCGVAPALAETYYVSTFGQLSAAFSAASADASSTIILTQDITMTANLSSLNKSVTIDTNGFTINGLTAVPNTGTSQLTLQGTFRGATQAGLGGTAFIQGSTSRPGNITNNGSITGGASTGAGGGLGVNLFGGGVAFINNGTITGGDGATSGGHGLQVRQVSTIVNTGTIQGGNGATVDGGMGVDLGGPGGSASSLTNSGIIRGAAGPNNGVGTSIGGVGVLVRVGTNPIVNSGLIEGTSTAAIWGNGATVSLDIVNSGTIRAGAGRDAIGWQTGVTPTTGSLTLELRAGSQIIGNVVANQAGGNDVLRLGGADNWTLDGGIGSTSQYRNFDALEKTGSSTWTLTGSGDFSGTTNINQGTLMVNGSLAGSAVTVASGGRLGGSGTVGALTLAEGGRIAPGNSIGTLTVDGAYVQNAGAVYEVEVDPGTVTSDRIQVNGTATLAAGAALSVINSTGAGFVAGQRYTILTSTGLTGDYGADIAIGPILSLRNSTDATNAYLTVVQTNTAGGIGGTGNEQQVGQAVDSLPTGNAVQTGLYNQATLDAARRALGQLAGEIHASAHAVLVDESWLLRAAVNDRLRSAFGTVGAAQMATLSYGFAADLTPAMKGPLPKPPSAERFAVWGQGYGSWGRTRSDGNAASLSRSTGGLLVGADAAVFESLRLGVVAGYSRSEFDVNRRLSSGESDNYHLGLYGGGQSGALGLRTGASYTWHDLSTRRGIVAAGLGDTLRADYDAGTAQVFGELGYRIDIGQIAFEPFAGLAYVNLHSDGFRERGGAAALSGDSDDTSLGYATLGLRAAATARLQGMDLTLRGGLGWRHAFGDVDPTTTLAFAGSNTFSIAGLPIARNAALVEAGLDVALGANTTLGASYTGQLAADAQDHAFKANFAVRF